MLISLFIVHRPICVSCRVLPNAQHRRYHSSSLMKSPGEKEKDYIEKHKHKLTITAFVLSTIGLLDSEVDLRSPTMGERGNNKK